MENKTIGSSKWKEFKKIEWDGEEGYKYYDYYWFGYFTTYFITMVVIIALSFSTLFSAYC